MIQNSLIVNQPFIETVPLTQVEESGYTYLHCKYTTSPKYVSDWWINIWKTSYLINRITRESVSLVDAINIPLAPEKYYLKHFGDSLSFVLVFPQLPEHWHSFDFIERCNGEIGLSAYNILRNSTGVYHVTIK
ncbi:MAG: hypothetical protein N2167_10695 [Flavobacteriales bacterium]|nr:hypothetical protein [Flavobacteriales bacterium]